MDAKDIKLTRSNYYLMTAEEQNEIEQRTELAKEAEKMMCNDLFYLFAHGCNMVKIAVEGEKSCIYVRLHLYSKIDGSLVLYFYYSLLGSKDLQHFATATFIHEKDAEVRTKATVDEDRAENVEWENSIVDEIWKAFPLMIGTYYFTRFEGWLGRGGIVNPSQHVEEKAIVYTQEWVNKVLDFDWKHYFGKEVEDIVRH